MKPTYYIYALVIVIIALLAFIIGERYAQAPSLGNTVMQTTPLTSTSDANTVTKPATTQTGTPKSTTSSKTPVVVKTPPRSTATPIPGAQDVPLYYSQALASSTALIVISNPPQNTSVTSPLTVTGQAVGSWFFEGVFPVYLYDTHGRLLAQAQARALSDWTTAGFVPFTATISFSPQIPSSHGILVLRNANPSGIAANAKAVQMQVTFP